MWNTMDLTTFLVLESKYGKELEGFSQDRNSYFLNECIKMNNNTLDTMKKTQEFILKSSKLEDKDFESLKESKKIFDESLEEMNRLSKILEMAVTPKEDKN